jgi:hypothetical protein
MQKEELVGSQNTAASMPAFSAFRRLIHDRARLAGDLPAVHLPGG